jgi:hypothetical protein
VTAAASVTTPVTVSLRLAGLFFLTAEYYLEGEASVNRVKVMIRAKVGGKYPYFPAVVNNNGRIKPGLALVNGAKTRVRGSYYHRYTEGGMRRLTRVGGSCGRRSSSKAEGTGTEST